MGNIWKTIKEHPKIAIAIGGGLAVILVIAYIRSRNSSSSSNANTTGDILLATPSSGPSPINPSGTGGGTGGNGVNPATPANPFPYSATAPYPYDPTVPPNIPITPYTPSPVYLPPTTTTPVTPNPQPSPVYSLAPPTNNPHPTSPPSAKLPGTNKKVPIAITKTNPNGTKSVTYPSYSVGASAGATGPSSIGTDSFTNPFGNVGHALSKVTTPKPVPASQKFTAQPVTSINAAAPKQQTVPNPANQKIAVHNAKLGYAAGNPSMYG